MLTIKFDEFQGAFGRFEVLNGCKVHHIHVLQLRRGMPPGIQRLLKLRAIISCDACQKHFDAYLDLTQWLFNQSLEQGLKKLIERLDKKMKTKKK